MCSPSKVNRVFFREAPRKSHSEARSRRFLEVAHGSSHGFSGAEESVQSTPTTEIRSCEKKARRAPNSWLDRLESLIEEGQGRGQIRCDVEPSELLGLP